MRDLLLPNDLQTIRFGDNRSPIGIRSRSAARHAGFGKLGMEWNSCRPLRLSSPGDFRVEVQRGRRSKSRLAGFFLVEIKFKINRLVGSSRLVVFERLLKFRFGDLCRDFVAFEDCRFGIIIRRAVDLDGLIDPRIIVGFSSRTRTRAESIIGHRPGAGSDRGR